MYLSVNLLGFLVRGLFSNPELDELEKKSNNFVKDEIKKNRHINKVLNIISLILFIFYLYLLLKLGNIGVLLTAIIIMIGRLPDLLWEVKNRKRFNPNLVIKKNWWYYFSSFLPWIAFPILYFSLF